MTSTSIMKSLLKSLTVAFLLVPIATTAQNSLDIPEDSLLTEAWGERRKAFANLIGLSEL